MLAPLPIDDWVPAIRDLVREHRAAVVVAAPGAGKTTRVAPALAADGPLILLQPRRIAARGLAARIASERGWTLGEEVGYQVRLERRHGPRTALLVATEGVLTRMLQADPLLSRYKTAVVDEFHERTIHADLGLALCRRAWRERGDLRVVVLSATLDAAAVAAFLDGCPVIDVPGRCHPLEIAYAPGTEPATAALDRLRDGAGHVLCFLPGAPEIRAVEERLRATAGLRAGARVLPLHGTLPAAAQDAALAPCAERKLILATNIAETSLTVDGVREVVDSGLHKVLRRDPATGIDRLAPERISQDSAAQRAGRAGRTAPGRVLRLWDARDELRRHREPEIERVDLAGPFLQLLACGADPSDFAWFERPPAEAARDALRLLAELGALDPGGVTALGLALADLPLHPRLGRVLLAAGGTAPAAAACAALAEGWRPSGDGVAAASDVADLADRAARAGEPVRAVARDLERRAREILGPAAGTPGPEAFRRAWLAGYPDRIAQRREPGSSRFLLASGHGARTAGAAGPAAPEYVVALDLAAGPRGPASEALLRLTCPVERDWLAPTRREVEHAFDEAAGVVRASECACLGEIVLTRRPVAADPAVAADLLAARVLARGLDAPTRALLARARFAGLAADERAWVARACAGATALAQVDVRGAALRALAAADLDRHAPPTLRVPGGRDVSLAYEDDGVYAAVKLQELFGLAASPRVGVRGEPVIFRLLAPSGRPVQTTRDLASFWERTYPEVRRELRGRYPRHAWPEDPWTAPPAARRSATGTPPPTPRSAHRVAAPGAASSRRRSRSRKSR